MADAKDIVIEIDEKGFRLMGTPISGPVPLEFINSILGTVPRRWGFDRDPWEKPDTRRSYVYDSFGIAVSEDLQRKLVYSLGCYFRFEHSGEWCKGIAEFSGRAIMCGLPLKGSMLAADALAAMPFLKDHLGWLGGEFCGQSALLVFSKDKEALAKVPSHRRKAVPETLETLEISLSTDWRWGTGQLPAEGDIGVPPRALGDW